MLGYLRATQEADGHWPQNQWVGGTRVLGLGIQLGETAMPVLLLDLLRRDGMLTDGRVASYWPMVRLRPAIIVRAGRRPSRIDGRTSGLYPVHARGRDRRLAGRRRARRRPR